MRMPTWFKSVYEQKIQRVSQTQHQADVRKAQRDEAKSRMQPEKEANAAADALFKNEWKKKHNGRKKPNAEEKKRIC